MPEDNASIPPGQPGQAGSQPKGIIGHIKKNWIMYSLGIGGATLVVALLSVKKSQQNAAAAAANPSYAVPQIGHVDTTGGMSADTSSIYSMIQGLTSTEAQNYNALQSIMNTQNTPASPYYGASLPDSLRSLLGNLDPSNPAKQAIYFAGGRQTPGYVTLDNPLTGSQLAAKYHEPFGYSDISANPLNKQYQSQLDATQGNWIIPAGSKVYLP